MKLLATLMSGIAQAKNGTADIYVRGSSTPQGYYNDFEGNVPNSGTITLDEYGQAEAYVNTLVRVLVKDVDGVTVKDYVEGDAATTVELRSASFTGTDYDGAPTAPGQPTTVAAALDRLVTSFGTVDFNVLVNGVSMTMQAFTANSLGVFYNVKNTSYSGGAAGDGVSDDTSAISDAIADCEANGGGSVFFPAGTYKITSVLTIPETVNLIGVARDQCIIVYTAATGSALDFPDSLVLREVQNLSIHNSGSTTAGLMSCDQVYLRFTRCELGDGTGVYTGLLDCTFPNDGTGAFEFVGTKMWTSPNTSLFAQSGVGAINNLVYSGADRIPVLMRDCEFLTVGDQNAENLVNSNGEVDIQGSTFDISSVSSSVRVIACAYGGSVVGNIFLDSALATFIGGINGPARGSGYVLTESGNQWGQGANPTSWAPYGTSDTDSLFESVATRWIEVVNNAAALTLWTWASPYGAYVIHRTAAGAQTVSVSALIEGQEYCIIFWNDAIGAGVTETLSASFLGSSSVTVNNNSAVIKNYRAVDVGNGSLQLLEIGTTATTNIAV